MKKLIFALLSIVLMGTCCFSFAGCEKEEPLSIVFLGDSIAEAILGPSPISERENYGYYALVGRMNGFEYYNRSVSGHKTAQFVKHLKLEDKGAHRTRELIKDADIIHVSILGNDVLQTDFSRMVVEAANGKYDIIDGILSGTKKDFAEAVALIREYNPSAILMFQTVYNPGDQDTSLLSDWAESTLANKGIDPPGYRALTAKLLTRLNDIIFDYLEEHPGTFLVADARKAFDEVYEKDRLLGNRLIYPDWIHPSNEGHAQFALTIQKLLLEQGVGNNGYADIYKDIRLQQLEKLYKDMPNYAAIREEISSAKTYEEVSAAYFNLTYGTTPNYSKEA